MSLEWKSFFRKDRNGQPVHVIWAERFPDLFEVHVPYLGHSVLYLNAREIGSDSDILRLTTQAQDMLAGRDEAPA